MIYVFALGGDEVDEVNWGESGRAEHPWVPQNAQENHREVKERKHMN